MNSPKEELPQINFGRLRPKRVSQPADHQGHEQQHKQFATDIPHRSSNY